MNLEFKAPNRKFSTPHCKYLGFVIEEAFTTTFPTMVRIARAPSYAKPFIGKRYVDIDKAIKLIDEVYGEKLVAKNSKVAYNDLIDLALAPDDATEYTPIIPKIDYSQSVVSNTPTD